MSCERTGGKEPTLKELSAFITGESETENDPVYGRSSTLTARVGSGNRSKKQPFMLKPATGTPITTIKTEVAVADASTNQGTGEVAPVEDDQVVGSSRSREEACKVCKGKHRISRCSVFLTKSLSWRRWFARLNALCYRVLSTSHVRKRCPEKKGCMEQKLCPLSHHSLLHAPGVTPREVNGTERNVDQSISARTNLTVNNATMENSNRSFVLLKAAPLYVVADNGTIITTYGLLDKAAVSSMITSQLAEKRKPLDKLDLSEWSHLKDL